MRLARPIFEPTGVEHPAVDACSQRVLEVLVIDRSARYKPDALCPEVDPF